MVDIHTHILPGIDDGAENIYMTLEMLRVAEKNGTKSIIATPHYCLEFAETPYLEVKDLVYKVNKLAESEGININIYPGQEVYFFEGIVNGYKDGIIGTLNDSRYMLIELPMREYDKKVFDVIFELGILGITPIIAHPERYKFIIDKPSLINKFIEEKILFQMNAGSLLGKYGKDVKKTCKILLENNIYNLIGSDAHNISNRSTDLIKKSELLKEITKSNLDRFTDNGVKIINNEEIMFIGKKIKAKKSVFTFFKTHHR